MTHSLTVLFNHRNKLTVATQICVQWLAIAAITQIVHISCSEQMQTVASIAISDEIERESDTVLPTRQLEPRLKTHFRPPKNPSTHVTTIQTPPAGGNNQSISSIHEKEFVTQDAKIETDCQRNQTNIRLVFNKEFHGIIGTGDLASSPCKILGNGDKTYDLKVNHQSSGCGSSWDKTTSSISNTLSIRFHPTLETGSDISKNLVCRIKVGDVIVGRKPGTRMVSPIIPMLNPNNVST